MQVKKFEDPTIIQTNYCTAPSTNSTYIDLGVAYHSIYNTYYSLNGGTYYSFSIYPSLSPVFLRFMLNSPYKSVWVDSDCDGVKNSLQSGAQITIGKNISVTTTKTLLVGIIGDNQFKMSIDGELKLYAYGQGTQNFDYLHLFPVTITPGQHYFSFTGIGDGSVNDALGVIIYDNTIEELLTPIPKTSWNVLWTAEESISEGLDIVTCPVDYSYDNEEQQCVRITSDTSNIEVGDAVLVTPLLICTKTPTITSWSMNWGDDTIETGTGAYSDTFEHTYAACGDYIITFEVIVNGSKTFSDSISVSIPCPEINYGLLYNWYAATDVRNISSSDDWDVPSYTDFKVLADYLGAGGDYLFDPPNNVGGKLKETGTTYWNSPNTGATNEVGFNGRGGGIREILMTAMFFNIKEGLLLWNKEEDLGFNAYALLSYINYDNNSLFTSKDLVSMGNYISATKRNGLSVRLLRNSTTLSHGETGIYIGNDGKTYPTICIGTQEWLADNLAETKYRNGDSIPEVTDNTAWAGLTTGALCAYNNDWNNV
jgi:uncharacterized protein (TIGR02145 family)